MIVSTKNRSTKYHSDKFHRSYGIQNWLCGKKFCLAPNAKYKVDKDQYKELLKEFIKYDNPSFDFGKLKHGIESMENYVQGRFNKFCTFCVDVKFKPPAPPKIDKEK